MREEDQDLSEVAAAEEEETVAVSEVEEELQEVAEVVLSKVEMPPLNQKVTKND